VRLAPGAFLLSPAATQTQEVVLSNRVLLGNSASRQIGRRHMANAEKVAAVTELTERFRGSSGAA
jgi:hypothetical protein